MVGINLMEIHKGIKVAICKNIHCSCCSERLKQLKSMHRGLVQLRYIHTMGYHTAMVMQNDGQDILCSGAEQRTSYDIFGVKYTYVYLPEGL